MAIIRVSCPVAHTTVTRVTDLEGNTTQVICPEYAGTAGVCRLKTRSLEGGPLAQLLDRLAEHRLDRRTTRCDVR
jgi:hypothetical protein